MLGEPTSGSMRRMDLAMVVLPAPGLTDEAQGLAALQA